MIEAFEYTANPARIIFGAGSVGHCAEAVSDLGCSRALVLSTPSRVKTAEALAEKLGSLCAGFFSGAVMHTPVDVTEAALAKLRAVKADCTLAIGGGSTTGLGKALALRTDLPQIVVPTTYAGSEVTPSLGQTENNVKTTLKDPRVLPEVVIYDPELTLDLSDSVTVNSLLNALAHAVEGLYARDRNPMSSLMAAEGIRRVVAVLPRLRQNGTDLQARSDALYGAWLCGSVLGSVGMALHHKLCHTLGGSFGLPHAETHAVVLPHAIAFNAVEVPELLAPLKSVLGSESPGAGLFALAKSAGAPTSLKELGMPEDGIERAAELAVANPYWNPRAVDRDLIRKLIEEAYYGIPPSG